MLSTAKSKKIFFLINILKTILYFWDQINFAIAFLWTFFSVCQSKSKRGAFFRFMLSLFSFITSLDEVSLISASIWTGSFHLCSLSSFTFYLKVFSKYSAYLLAFCLLLLLLWFIGRFNNLVIFRYEYSALASADSSIFNRFIFNLFNRALQLW